jgi:hypothetical protein
MCCPRLWLIADQYLDEFPDAANPGGRKRPGDDVVVERRTISTLEAAERAGIPLEELLRVRWDGPLDRRDRAPT